MAPSADEGMLSISCTTALPVVSSIAGSAEFSRLTIRLSFAKRGSRRFATSDNSRNNYFVALATFGEGNHNNHHAFPWSAVTPHKCLQPWTLTRTLDYLLVVAGSAV